jgi:hypothetical protein
MKTGTQNGKKDKMQSAKEQQQQAEPTQETTTSPNPQEPGENKRPTTQTGGMHKKIKAQRTPPEYTIMDDDGEMIARMVQDFLSEDFDHVAHHRDRIQEELVDMWHISSSKSGKGRQQAVGEQNHQHHRWRKEWK